DPEGVHRADAGADPRQAGRYGGGGELARPTRRLERRIAEGEAGGKRRGVGAAGAVRSAARVPGTVDRDCLVAVEEEVGAVGGVTAGHDHRVGAEGVDGTGQLILRSALAQS